MSVKVEASHGGIPHGKIAAAGIIIALVSLYIAVIGHEVLGFDYFAFFGGIAAIGALIWGNSAIKRLCSYGIGAGVPSAGMLAFGSGLFGMFLGIAIGAILLKDNAATLAAMAGIPQAVIGVTVLAIGTSLPELVTMIIAVKKGEASLSIGNIIGANTIDLAIILPLSAFIAGGAGLPVTNIHLLITMPITLLVILIGIVPTLILKKFSRWQGVVMFVIYLGYFVYNIVYTLA